MNRKFLTHTAAIVGLLTAVLALGAAVIGYRNEMAAQQAQIDAQQADIQKQKMNLDAQRQAIEQEQHARICDFHEQKLEATEQRFSDLMEEHGLLMNSIKQCFENNKTDEDKKNCTMGICLMAYAFTKGSSNCATVFGTSLSIKTNLDREQISAQADKCTVPDSAAERYFN